MQIRITHKVNQPLSLPINYNHIIQSIIYHALTEYPDFADAAHNGGFEYEQRKYKVYTFSNIEGHYRIKNKKITFDNVMSFEIRSPFIPFINIVGNEIAKNGITYGDRHISDVQVTPGYKTLDDYSYHIRMTSPICVYSTDPVTKWTEYYSPYEEEFYYQIIAAFERKYKAFNGETPPGNLWIRPHKVTENNKVITRYKNSLIEAWSGEYLIEGNPECLTFLYDSGLGSKNPGGFGMFDIVENKYVLLNED